MSQPIPLTATLRIESEDIIIDDSRRLVDNLVVKNLSPKAWVGGFSQWPVKRNARPITDLRLRCGSNGLGREEIQHAKRIIWPEETPCITWRTVFVEGEGVEGREVEFCVFNSHGVCLLI